ncbi:hypothetical protein ROZALSC1DRAFT_23790 [Rozella allomycis CSF55]|uniref:Retrovirus-related Pol polyprotein from transposon TNT 1-94-like beta-barrel domain-containing protein n=1 Tax=Rozella allomycis (strain CSF55) TaxID=988480 RepID=A0A4P9YFT4_ROZAC|nr:hypothetical protein ROZALSC1DRAFT_23790 [Rozella allomycis CSF55]
MALPIIIHAGGTTRHCWKTSTWTNTSPPTRKLLPRNNYASENTTKQKLKTIGIFPANPSSVSAIFVKQMIDTFFIALPVRDQDLASHIPATIPTTFHINEYSTTTIINNNNQLHDCRNKSQKGIMLKPTPILRWTFLSVAFTVTSTPKRTDGYHVSSHETFTNLEPLNALTTGNEWIIDTGCTSHMTNDRSVFKNFTPRNDYKIRIAKRRRHERRRSPTSITSNSLPRRHYQNFFSEHYFIEKKSDVIEVLKSMISNQNTYLDLELCDRTKVENTLMEVCR